MKKKKVKFKVERKDDYINFIKVGGSLVFSLEEELWIAMIEQAKKDLNEKK